MNILFVIDNLNSGGAQRQMVTLVLGLSERDHKADMFIYHPEGDYYKKVLIDAGTTFIEYQKKRPYDFHIPIILERQFKYGGYNVVLSFLRTPNIYAELAT
jgi:GalNAc-alpha-(1->4)-GalNAc-alpha-(1->3)-diNAcBac-PP-undecaprenol alpha-1,4-N-acetyl-D-galactosaminyltransferase